MGKPLSDWTEDELHHQRAHYQHSIDCNDGRLSAYSSMDLDHSFDMVEMINAELKRREF